ncbi:hypothetical protein RhiLY_03894 [Ceratobasidium sp. AG-Ba]|nr:hypothetical protein RhiLY_03894 [Ceratobasidium sp. AG-Ba]
MSSRSASSVRRGSPVAQVGLTVVVRLCGAQKLHAWSDASSSTVRHGGGYLDTVPVSKQPMSLTRADAVAPGHSAQARRTHVFPEGLLKLTVREEEPVVGGKVRRDRQEKVESEQTSAVVAVYRGIREDYLGLEQK